MRIPTLRLLHACLPALLALSATIALPGGITAQCTEEPCGQLDHTPPTISFSPSSGTFPAGPRSVTINWSDNSILDHDSRVIVFGGDTVTAAFTYVQTNNWTARSTGTVTIGAGGNTLTAYICDRSADGPNCTTASVIYAGPVPSVRVSPETPSISVAVGTAAALRFRVVNTGTGRTTYGMSCSAGLTGCTPSATQVTVAAGDSAWVDVSVTPPSAGLHPVQLTATSGSVSGSGTASTNVLLPPPAGFPGDSASLLRIERDACVVIAVGPGAASECGDLRVVHPLPSVRVLNTARTPVLTYNSDHARPLPVVAAQFAGPTGTVPDAIRAVLTVNGTQVADTVWRTGWGANQVRRIAVSFNAGSYRTGVYPYTLTVTAEWLNGTRQTLPQASRSGRMIVVNRSTSPFGAGWWLAGVEQLATGMPADTLLLWVGGDGSARLYRGSPGGPWRAEGYDRPDSLYRPAGGTGYVRPLPGGAKVHFDSDGNHVATENALGHVTRFRWRSVPLGTGSEMRLDTLVLPSPQAQPDLLRYVFDYGSVGPGCTTSTTGLTRVRSPAPDGTYRESWLCGDVLRRVTRIRDFLPDTTSVRYAYYSNTGWMIGRTDRRGGTHGFSYIRVRFHTSDRTLAPGVVATTRVQAVQTLGMYGTSVRADSVHVIYDGPRPGAEVCDCVWWKVDRWGAPTSMRNILGQETTVRRGDGRWPGLVTESVAPNGLSTTAAYDSTGNVATATTWSPYGDTRNATTTYRWDSRLDRLTRVVSPEGVVSSMGYDQYGRREWEQVGPDSVRRVRYRYHDPADPRAPGLLRAVIAPGESRDSVAYDARGNLASITDPLTVRTEYHSDRIGRVVSTRVPVQVAGAIAFQVDSTIYSDTTGQVRETIATGPAMNGVPQQWLHVRNYYDAEGNLTDVARWSRPDDAVVDTIRTRWEYDLGGRQIVEIAPDSTWNTWADNPRDSTFYDLAGNPVRVRTRRFAESLAANPADPGAAYIRMQYDALNRLTRRIFPAVFYAPRGEGIPAAMGEAVLRPYPYIPGEASINGLRIPADTATFEYHPVTGLQSAALNGNAEVRRQYYPNGALKYDSLHTRTVNRTDFQTHRYGLEYRYDRDGRTTQLLHPAQLRPPTAAAQGRIGNEFGYDPATGALARVTDPMGHEFRYGYTMRGEPEWLALPGGVTHRYTYNIGGQLERHRIENAVTGAGRYPSLIRDETFGYDWRGKLVNSINGEDTLKVTYSGLGHLRLSSNEYSGWDLQTGLRVSYIASEAPIHDALGNIVSIYRGTAMRMYDGTARDASHTDRNYSTADLRYQRGTGRLRIRGSSAMTDTIKYDAGGNEVFVTGLPPVSTNPRQDRASFYDGGGRLWATDVRRVQNAAARGGLFFTFEEYRLDALGRRVLVRTRKECENPGFAEEICTFGSVRRTVWAGDRELYEIQMPDAYLENDTVLLPIEPRFAEGYDPNPLWGRAAYTYGGGIDQPLSVVRMGYTNALYRWNAFAIIPHWNARGQAQTGTYHDGKKERCQATYQGWQEYQDKCVQLEWSEGLFPYSPARQAGEHWHGTLLNEKRDESGLLYRRNRYYDPATGRFTQEDPIGLAGGVNVYGFANGDPVSYADPYGLAACPTAPKGDPRRNNPSWSDCTAEEIRLAQGAVDQPLFADPLNLLPLGSISKGLSWLRGAAGSAISRLSGRGASEAGEHIVLGIADYGVERTAAAVGGRHLMNDPGWRTTFMAALGDARTKFTVSLDGLTGSSTYQKVMGAVQRGYGGDGLTNWEMSQLHQAGRLGNVNFVQTVRGQVTTVANPFQ